MNGKVFKAFKSLMQALFIIITIIVASELVGLHHPWASLTNAWISGPVGTRWLCQVGHAKEKAPLVIEDYRSTNELFVKLFDYFWNPAQELWSLPYGFKGSELLLAKVLAQAVDHRLPDDIQKLSCRTCVVVGNGNTLRNSSLGKLINQHDIVIRLNDAPVKGYEQDVGNKTTMRLFYPESAFFDPEEEDPDTLLVLIPFKPDDLRWLKELLYNDKRIMKGFWKIPPLLWNVDPTKLRILHPYFLNETTVKLLKITPVPLAHQLKLKNKEKPTHPTTGLIAITMALHYCDMVYVAGFGYPGLNDTQVPIHYYETRTIKSMEDSEHNITREGDILKQLADIGAINYLKNIS
ncbi:CMP-N-acetylneuraminate-beta-galactosamide-alpha-2,3-sialyltransferase 4 [Protopterus annectens]|uniref:CMP-N-acetylneuraminate-beta-galactosamide- alpha-2,3-sialyltransferase 4 n=1 Tax=Protopterus annectens TaxID=7888 RepID=UPI001CFA2380|nr:CMP-N-acetylneuraminate-beta-galactosamide-alpha-2,3-sialyltransferase 4 [Protopterus annectens]